MAARWPQGWRCPRCDHDAHYKLARQSHGLFQCQACQHQTSLTAGTLMADAKLALTTWFLAIHLIGQAKNGMSSLELKRQLGVSYPTAGAWPLAFEVTDCDLKAANSSAVSWNMKSAGNLTRLRLSACTSTLVATP
jgi:transposase-like protein